MGAEHQATKFAHCSGVKVRSPTCAGGSNLSDNPRDNNKLPNYHKCIVRLSMALAGTSTFVGHYNDFDKEYSSSISP